MAILARERAVAAPLEHDDLAPPRPPRRQSTPDPDLETPAEGAERPVQQRHQRHQHEHLARPDHPPLYTPATRQDNGSSPGKTTAPGASDHRGAGGIGSAQPEGASTGRTPEYFNYSS